MAETRAICSDLSKGRRVHDCMGYKNQVMDPPNMNHGAVWGHGLWDHRLSGELGLVLHVFICLHEFKDVKLSG